MLTLLILTAGTIVIRRVPRRVASPFAADFVVRIVFGVDARIG